MVLVDTVVPPGSATSRRDPTPLPRGHPARCRSASSAYKVTHLLSGFVPAPFELYDSKGKLVKLDDFKGKYIYLNFCTTSSYTCLQEFTLLQKLYEKHKKLLEIVTICVDNDKQDISNLLQNTGYNWTFLHYGNKPEIVKDFDIRAYPTYFLIGPDRKLILSPAPSPRENFEVQFFKILRSKGEI